MSLRLSLGTAATLVGAAAFLGVSSSATSASACGGFFCSASAPVDQAAERIIFAQDEAGHVTQIVEVLYEGPADAFSWVLPVPGVPEPDVSSRQVFDRLQTATAPSYNLNQVNSCPGDFGPNAECVNCEIALGGDVNDAAGPPAVTVLDAGSVGPFDYETIAVSAADDDPADVAVRWLEDNGYDVGPRGAEVLRPYLQNGLNLIAFRLQKGQSSGAIRPIVLEYDARAMAIPILPTAVAAKDDMPILVWTLGAERAVPTNYLDLELNELLIDWFNFSPTYDAVVTAAADEAGGQGFVTEYAGPALPFLPAIEPQQSDVERALATDYEYELLSDALYTITAQLGAYDGFLEVAAEHLPLREGLTVEDYVRCSYCYFEGGTTENGVEIAPAADTDPIYDTDMDAFRAALLEQVLQPFFDLADLMRDNAYMTRLYTTMSAEEMTKDPTFEFNPDAEEVSNVHTAEYSRDCDTDAWQVTLPGGAVVYGEELEWPYSLFDTEFPVTLRTRQFSTSGAPEVVADNKATIQSLHGDKAPGTRPPNFSADGESEDNSAGGGGCAYGRGPFGQGRGAGPWALLGLGLWAGLGIARRRLS